MRSSIVAFAALTIAAASQAESDGLAYPLADSLSMEPYGQFHFARQSFDDGVGTTTNIVDVTNSNSRFGFYIKRADTDDGLSFHFETGLGFRPSQKTSQTVTPKFWDWSRRDLRKVQVVHRSDLGTFRFGQGSMPADGAAESDADEGGTVVLAKSTIPEASGAYFLRDASGNLGQLTIGDTFDNFDGSRRFRLRYDSPRTQGVSIALAYGEEILTSGNDNTYYDVALRYEEDFGRFELKGAVAVAWENTGAEVNRISIGSVSLLDRNTGLHGSLATGKSHGGTDPAYLYVKGGWNAQFLSVGLTTLVVEYFRGRDYGSAGARSVMWGAGVIQSFDNQNVEIYAGLRGFAYDDLTNMSYRDARAIQIGARWQY